MDQKEFNALISLLDDPDQEVYEAISSNLVSKGVELIPNLEKVWEKTLDENLQERLECIIHDIQFNSTKNSLQQWLDKGATNVFEGACYLAKFQFPEVEYLKLDVSLERIKEDVWLEFNSNLTELEKIKVLNYVFFEIHSFSRNTANFYSPQNSYINQVIEARKGNPISIAILYMEVGRKLGLPLYGVNLPKNFILAYINEDEGGEKALANVDDVLFYINPYNKGGVLSRNEIDRFLKEQKLAPTQTYYLPCSNEEIIIRLINNLLVAYDKLAFLEKISKLKELLKVFKK